MPPGSPFGPGVVALVTYLHGCQMVSYSIVATGRLNGRSPLAAIRAALTLRSEPATP
jgi:hypothetical protein